MAMPMSMLVKDKVQIGARNLGAANPLNFVGPLIDRSFSLPAGDKKYAMNALTPGAAPCELSFSEQEPHVLRFTIEPLGPESSPVSRRDEATREMRRLVGSVFGRDALHWFDQHSEEWRGMSAHGWLQYGAWFGSAFDEDGLYATKVYYELGPHQVNALPPALARLVRTATAAMPNLMPVFTSIGCGRDSGSQRVTFLHRGPLRLADLSPLLNQLGLAHQLPSLMQVVGLALGGRFDLPHRSVLIGLRDTYDGPELKLEVLLGALPDVPRGFLDLLMLGLSERPRHLAALQRWLKAFSNGEVMRSDLPDLPDLPGNFSVLSVRVTPQTPARVSLYMRPIEFELREHLRNGAGDAE